jgi:hypothetical protein
MLVMVMDIGNIDKFNKLNNVHLIPYFFKYIDVINKISLKAQSSKFRL